MGFLFCASACHPNPRRLFKFSSKMELGQFRREHGVLLKFYCLALAAVAAAEAIPVQQPAPLAAAVVAVVSALANGFYRLKSPARFLSPLGKAATRGSAARLAATGPPERREVTRPSAHTQPPPAVAAAARAVSTATEARAAAAVVTKTRARPAQQAAETRAAPVVLLPAATAASIQLAPSAGTAAEAQAATAAAAVKQRPARHQCLAAPVAAVVEAEAAG